MNNIIKSAITAIVMITILALLNKILDGGTDGFIISLLTVNIYYTLLTTK